MHINLCPKWVQTMNTHSYHSWTKWSHLLFVILTHFLASWSPAWDSTDCESSAQLLHNFLRKPVISKPDNLFNKNNGMFVQLLVRVWTHSFFQMLSRCIFLTQRDNSSGLWTTFWLNKYDVVWVLKIVSEWSELKVVVKVTPMWRWHLSTRPKHLKYIWKCNWCSMPHLLIYRNYVISHILKWWIICSPIYEFKLGEWLSKQLNVYHTNR